MAADWVALAVFLLGASLALAAAPRALAEVTARRALGRTRRLEAARACALVRFLAPDELRGRALLVLDAGAGEPPEVWLDPRDEGCGPDADAARWSEAVLRSEVRREELEGTGWQRWGVAPASSEDEGEIACLVFDAWPPTGGAPCRRLRLWLTPALDAVARIELDGRDGEPHPARF